MFNRSLTTAAFVLIAAFTLAPVSAQAWERHKVAHCHPGDVLGDDGQCHHANGDQDAQNAMGFKSVEADCAAHGLPIQKKDDGTEFCHRDGTRMVNGQIVKF